MSYGQLPDAARQKLHVGKSQAGYFPFQVWKSSISLVRWSYLNHLPFPVEWWCTEGSKEQRGWCSGSAHGAAKQGEASPKRMCCRYWDVLPFGTQNHGLTGKINQSKPNSDIVVSRYLHLWLLSFSWVGGDQKKKSKKQNPQNTHTHKLEDAGVKKENKSTVKGLLGLTQDCLIMGEQQPEKVFSKLGFFKLKEFRTGTGCDANITSNWKDLLKQL